MRFVSFAAAAASAVALLFAAGAAAQTCTRGRVFVTEATTGSLHVLNADDSDWAETASFTAPTGAGAVSAYATESGHTVVLVNGGSVGANYSDGAVRFFTAGLDGAAADTVAQHAYAVQCARPIHFTSTNGWVSVFCDGFWSADSAYTRNSSVYFVNENHFSHSAALDAFGWALPGQQHGVGWALDEDHFLYSVATDARVGRVAGSTSSPAGFSVVYRNRSEVHDLNAVTDPHRSCAGFHGESHAGPRFAFGCDHATDSLHDGILMVTKDEARETYTSSKIGYPTSLAGNGIRTGTIAANARSGWFVGNFGSNFILAFTGRETTAIALNFALNTTGACGWGIDQSYDSYVFTLLPTGYLNAYTIDAANGFVLARSIQVYSSPVTCTGNFVVKSGWGGAWIARRDVPGVAFVNIPRGTVTAKALSYTPNQLVVAAQTEYLCAACDTCRDGRGNTQPSGAAHSAAALAPLTLATVIALALSVGRL